MANEPRRRRKAPDVETSTPPDLLTDDLRQRDPPQTPPDSMAPDEKVAQEEDPVGGGFTPRADGGNDQHPSTTRIRRTPPRTITSGKSIV